MRNIHHHHHPLPSNCLGCSNATVSLFFFYHSHKTVCSDHMNTNCSNEAKQKHKHLGPTNMLLVNLQLVVTIQALMLPQLTVRGNTSTGFTYCELLLDVLAGNLVHAVDDGSLCGCPHALSQCTYVWQNTRFDDLQTIDTLPSSDFSVLITTVIITIINRFIFFFWLYLH